MLNSLSIIPVEQIEAVRAAFSQSFPGDNITAISLLSGGLSGSSVYKIVSGKRLYVLKLNTRQEAPVFRPDAMTLAASAGIAPKLYFNDTQEGISISDFVINQPIRGIFGPEQLTLKLAGKIKTVHAIPFETEGTSAFATVDALMEKFKSSGKLSGPVFEECFRQYEILKSKYICMDADKVLSHNDLNPNNILCDGKEIWFIDWDVASLNDRYIDLANSANYFVHTEDQERLFLQAYFGREAERNELARLFVMRQVCRIIYSLMMLELAIQGKPSDFKHDSNMDDIDLPTFGSLMAMGKISLSAYEGQFLYGKALMNAAVQHMGSTKFEAALAQF